MIDFIEQNIEQNKIDTFFAELTDIFIYSLENGLANLHELSIRMENEHTLSAVKVGINCIQNGLTPLLMTAILETTNLIAFKGTVDSKQELFELKLLEIVMPYIQSSEVEKFLDLLNQLCSLNFRSALENRLTKYIDSFSKDADE